MSVSIMLAALAAALPPAAVPSTPALPIMAERFGLYAVTDDLPGAAAFYERFFGKAQFRVPGMVGFDVAGGLYAVVDRQSYAVTAIRGDTVRGYIKVADIRATHRAATAAAPDAVERAVTTEGRFSFFRVRDPDGNLIEFYAVATG